MATTLGPFNPDDAPFYDPYNPEASEMWAGGFAECDPALIPAGVMTFDATLTVTTGPDINAEYFQTLFELVSIVGDVWPQIRVQSYGSSTFSASGDDMGWILSCGTSYAPITLSPNTEYTAVFHAQDGLQTVTFAGVTVVDTEAYTTSDGLSSIYLVVGAGSPVTDTPTGRLESISVASDGIADETIYASTSCFSPLTATTLLAVQVQAARVAMAGPLGASSAIAFATVSGVAVAQGIMGAPSVIAFATVSGVAAAQGIMGAPAVTAYHDFTGALGSTVTHYVMDLITPTGTVRVPVSSWQATLQTGSSNYVQCVIPACTVWVSAILAATEFVISRRATLPNGAAIEMEMARAPADQAQFDQGPQRHTCTLSGYSDAFAEDLDPPATYDRLLTGVRSISTGDGNLRVRCAIDWLLRPGHRAYVNGTPFVVGYINYYAPSGFDAYMDAGSR